MDDSIGSIKEEGNNLNVGYVNEYVNAYRRLRLNAYRDVTRLFEGHEFAAKCLAAFTMAALTGLLAQISILTPLTPVPYTMQVFGVALMGGLLGPRWGAVSASMYLLMGMLGLPVFALQVAKAGGWAAAYTSVDWGSGFGLFVFGPRLAASAGYLLGYPPAAYLTGMLTHRRQGDHPRRFVVAAALAGLFVLFLVTLDLVMLTREGRQVATYPHDLWQIVWYGVLLAGLGALCLAVVWLALTTKARRERIELFAGSVLGLGALYATGALWFYFAAQYKLLPLPLDLQSVLRFTVLPFIAVDILKILLAIGLLTLVRPTHQELEATPKTA